MTSLAETKEKELPDYVTRLYVPALKKVRWEFQNTWGDVSQVLRFELGLEKTSHAAKLIRELIQAKILELVDGIMKLLPRGKELLGYD